MNTNFVNHRFTLIHRQGEYWKCSSCWTSKRPQHDRLPILARPNDNLYPLYRDRNPREPRSQAYWRKQAPTGPDYSLGTHYYLTRLRYQLLWPARRPVLPWVG